MEKMRKYKKKESEGDECKEKTTKSHRQVNKIIRYTRKIDERNKR